ncbi:MAG: glycosyltransferase [Phycisphaerae bacterium]
MSIVSTTMCYPTPAAPTQGVFIARRLEAIHRLLPIQVVAPAPWFPFWRPAALSADAGSATETAPPVVRPRMLYVPGVMKRWDAGCYARAFRCALAALQAAEPVRLIDAHFVWPDGVGAWRVASAAGVPFVCTIRGKLVSQLAAAPKRRRIVEMLRRADALIAVSRSLADLANAAADIDLRVRVIPNGIDRALFHRTERGRALPDGPAHPDARSVVSVGHLQALKGFHHLVEIWPEVRRESGDIRLILVGGDAGEPAYARRLRARIDAVNARCSPRGSAAAVSLLGRQPPQAIAKLLNAADLFALASRSEGWCNAIAEALACGCPVVATDVGGNREIVRDERLGLLVPPADRGALRDAVCRALARQWDRSHIARLGGQRDWQQVGRECVDVLESVLNRHRRAE